MWGQAQDDNVQTQVLRLLIPLPISSFTCTAIKTVVVMDSGNQLAIMKIFLVKTTNLGI